MVKPDVKHNYYSDLDLPVTASVDDVRKAYRKLALQFHPDRNAGKEAECVPRFQAIQAANEVLSDPTTKARYDADRRKAGLYGSSTTYKPSVPTPGNPYAATSAYPPPPRRTQPGTYQRPATQGTSGADRFSHFPRAAPTAPRKDPAHERTEQFRAWQSMNTGTQGSKQARPTPAPPQPARSPKPPTPSRPGMPSRQDTKLPSEEQIRAGMRHGKASGLNGETLDARQTAWQSFRKAGPADATRSSNQRPVPATPRRPGGFDPNAPGSDERPAPHSSHYSHRTRSEDFTADGFPPPPPGPPPASAPHSPTSPQAPRAYPDPLRSFKQRTYEEDAPYSEGNRTSTPYASVNGEKTRFSSEGLRRSASTRDTSKLHPESPASSARARSTSPLGRSQNGNTGKQKGRPFLPGMYSSSSEASSDETDGPDDSSPNIHPADTPPRERKFAKPKTRSRRVNDSSNSPSASPVPESQSDVEQPSMQQRKSSTNMYATPSFSSTFANGIPNWAVPSSVLLEKRAPRRSPREIWETDPVLREASMDELQAYMYFRRHALERFGVSTTNFPMGDFLNWIQLVRMGDFMKIAKYASGLPETKIAKYATLLSEIITRFPSVGRMKAEDLPADRTFTDRFSIPIHHDTFTPTNGKSRSVENINTNFSPEGWSGKFAGSSDYFAPPGRRSSPARRTGAKRGVYTPDSGAEAMPPPPPPDSTRPSTGNVPIQPPDFSQPATSQDTFPPSQGTFSEEQWKSTFKDASWTWPPPPSTAPPTETKPGPRSKNVSRKASKLSSKASSHVSGTSNASNQATTGTRDSPFVVDDEEVHEPESDAMDIDTPPPARPVPDVVEEATPTQAETPKGARVYAVPLSEWRQQQEANRESPSAKRQARTASTVEPELKTNLDDLAHVEPIARSADGGLRNLADLSATLPFASRPSAGPGTTAKEEPQTLQIPAIPKAPIPPFKWTKSSWLDHVQRFNTYLQHHHTFNRTILAHFRAREKMAEARMQGEWLAATGDAFESYARDCKQDEHVKEVWMLAGEKHVEAVRGFEASREQIRRLIAGVGLGDGR